MSADDVLRIAGEWYVHWHIAQQAQKMMMYSYVGESRHPIEGGRFESISVNACKDPTRKEIALYD